MFTNLKKYMRCLYCICRVKRNIVFLNRMNFTRHGLLLIIVDKRRIAASLNSITKMFVGLYDDCSELLCIMDEETFQ